MNIANHSNDSNLPPLPRRPSPFWNKRYLPVMLLAILLTTMLDLFFVKRGCYAYPVRPFPKAFSFNIVFNLVIMPMLIWVYLHLMNQLNHWGRAGLILLISLLMPIFEKLAEELGFFQHSDAWHHIYSFFGYFAFLSLLYLFERWLASHRG